MLMMSSAPLRSPCLLPCLSGTCFLSCHIDDKQNNPVTALLGFYCFTSPKMPRSCFTPLLSLPPPSPNLVNADSSSKLCIASRAFLL